MATWVGHPGVDLNYAVKLDNPENHAVQPKITMLCYLKLEL